MYIYLAISMGIIGCTSFILTGCFRKYALNKSIIDIPNARSSHSVPTPRGGGVAIVLTFFTSIFLLILFNLISRSVGAALIGAGLIVAVTGLIDDRGHIAAKWRLLAHFFAASWGLYWLGGVPQVEILDSQLHLGWLGYPIATVFCVWLLNLYNFMDGIDGIAGIEGITVCFGGVLVFLIGDFGSLTDQMSTLALLMAILGFLLWNFPTAKIFMGDVGSGFLGLTFGLLSIQAASVAPQLFWSWIILLGVFIVDATLTLLCRLARGEKIYEAHRSHAYQNASRYYNSHKPVAIAVGLINLLWLLPLALMSAVAKVDGLIATIIGYVPLIVIALKFNAGRSVNEM